jgi:phosphopantothenoylcysteine decarboxylase/phosphopantothenate--cysteine ligase
MSSLPLADKRVLLGVSGSIAAYKAADLCSRLGKLGASVHVVLTAHAERFIGVPTLRALTHNPVLTDLFDEPQTERIAHIDLAQSADLILVAPASANLVAKMAHGIADDMLSTCLLAAPPTTPLLLAPAMNSVMWDHPATRANLTTVQARGVQVVQPGYGVLACLDVGYGKLADVDEIVRAVVDRLTPNQTLRGKRILLTAGATREPLDPVRFLSNRSSGKMGYAIAAEAAARGAEVTLVSGYATIEAPSGVDLVRVGSAEEMYQACAARFDACDLFIAAAAVADYTPVDVAPQKIKKSAEEGDGETLTLTLRQTTHILATLAARKRPGQIVVGFAAETENVLENALAKLRRRNLDLVVANDVTQAGAGFDTDTNIVTLIWPGGFKQVFPMLPKREVAGLLLTALEPRLTAPDRLAAELSNSNDAG